MSTPRQTSSKTIADWPDTVHDFQGIPDMEPFEASRDQLLPPSERDWLERNAEALAAHGKLIAETGLAGEEFDRI
jgi:hypothetical protein